MSEIKKQCPFCGGIMTPIYNGNREKHVIYGWECSRMNCQFSQDGEMLLHGNMKKIVKLQARITELEKQAVVWHKYPDKKPDSGKECLVLFDDVDYSLDIYNNTFSWMGCLHEYPEHITHWAYLPETPKEVK